ncbi:hypothetical protein [Haloarcula pellucida]|uniref:hypothetical protein n=1 Tax=Haloarcula pellucida TaxID=1427151 RepID=UPI001E3E7E4B|nr:hypothetical protein [Halomicroarcula pellucida]
MDENVDMTQRTGQRTDLAEWFFFDGGPGAPRYGDDPTKHAVDHDTETFVREVLQNANDQSLDDDGPVEVTFRFETLSGEERTAFLEALGWGKELSTRLRAVTEAERGRGHNDLFGRLEDPEGELRLLVVEDEHTTGLTGSWDDDSNYSALVRDELYSSKQDDRAGGSYGLGKSVLWTFSGASTVVFNSNLAPHRTERDERQRLIARTKLPTHQLDDGVTYQGAGWLCQPKQTDDGVRPDSLWGNEATELANRLHVDRPETPGTSALVVDYRDPTRDKRPEIDELADEFVEAAVKYFWPAMLRDDLRVTVEWDEESRIADVRDVPAVRPFVDCFESRFVSSESLEESGDVAGVDIPVQLPPRADGEPTPDGDVRLAARLASPADDDSYLNNVAMFRGAGMVVKYYDQSRVAFSDRNFHAVLACGEAKSPESITDGDREVDRFLRYAEPPEHDDWQSTENLREHYQQGFRTALDDMFDTLRDGLRHLVSQTDGRGQVLADRVRKRFPIHGGQARTRSMPSPSTVFDIGSSSGFDEDHWTFTGYIEPLEDDFESWTATVSLTGVGEDGSRYDDISIARIDAEGSGITTRCEDGVGHVTAESGTGRVRFEGVSERVGEGDVRSGRVGETQLEIRAELRTGGED